MGQRSGRDLKLCVPLPGFLAAVGVPITFWHLGVEASALQRLSRTAERKTRPWAGAG